MSTNAEIPPLTREQILEISRKRLADSKALAMRRKYFKFVALACVLLSVVAVFNSTSNDAATYFQHSYAYTTQNAACGCTWAWNTAGKLYNTTYTGVSVWIYNTTPTNATDAPVAPPPAPPKEAPPAPRDPKNAPKHSTNSSTTNGHNTTEDAAKDNTMRGENKTEDATNNTTRGENKTEDATNNTTRGENKTEDAANNTTRGENKTEDAANNSTTGSEEATDSPYTVLRVLGEVAVFAVSFAGYGCYLIATMG